MNQRHYSKNPLAALSSIWNNRMLLKQFVRRDVMSRYRGSFLGILWTLLVPLLMLGVYTVVFTVVFKARFSEVGTGADGEFAVILFAGIIIHSMLAECLINAPNIIINNVNLVKKVIFPLEILAPVVVLTMLVQTLISFVVLLLGCLIVYGSIPWTVFYIPLILLPYIVFIQGVVWFVSSLGVFVRDVSHIVGVLATVLLFLSTVFFPASRLPESFQWMVYANPISTIVDQVRMVLIQGSAPDFVSMAVYSIFSVAVFTFGHIWFAKTRHAFADAL